jgi:hypothetical protein
MTGLASRGARFAAKVLMWVAYAIAGILIALVFGWIPPELAVMLGSRHPSAASPAAPADLTAVPPARDATRTTTARRGTPRERRARTDPGSR